LFIPAPAVLLQLFELEAHHGVGRIRFKGLFQVSYGRGVIHFERVSPYDWSRFLQDRLTLTAPHAPLGGTENGGWKLEYDSKPPDIWKAYEDYTKSTNLMYSLGIEVKEDGTIGDVASGHPAENAGIAPATKIIAVNNRQFTPTILREAVQAMKPIELLIARSEMSGYFSTTKFPTNSASMPEE